ncbi:MAG TPA: aminotransferase class V-fold PLP-dependent enzyme, partial [Thermomicrobiales bacterium]|nr:aminotransferase class V-fold PLP-dependent enzyme [Thermomicrobiales bacterium]
GWKQLRSLIADIFGADADEIALMRSTTEGLNVALLGLDWQRGDEVITVNLEHGGLYSPLALLAHRQGVVVRTVDVGYGEGDVVAQLMAACTPRTRAISISHLQWSTGAIMPLKELAIEARQRGIVTIVDAAQAAGQIPVDVHDLGVDAYALSGQKWLCGPGGSGALYVRRESLSLIKPTYIRYGTFDPTGFIVPKPGAERYEMGEVYNPATRAQAAVLRWLVDEVGLNWLYDRIATLGRRCWDALRVVPGVTVITPSDRMAGIVCFNAAGWPAKALTDALTERGFTIRHVDQRPCPLSVRVSAGWWNTEEEVDAFAGAVAELASMPPAGGNPGRGGAR